MYVCNTLQFLIVFVVFHQLTQTDEWMRLSKQSMQDGCLSEIRRNASVREEEASSKDWTTVPGLYTAATPSNKATPTPGAPYGGFDIWNLVEMIETVSCPNDCSFHGNCSKGRELHAVVSCECIASHFSSCSHCSVSEVPRLQAKGVEFESLVDHGLSGKSTLFL